MPNGELISAPVSLLSQAESSISEYLNEYSPEILTGSCLKEIVVVFLAGGYIHEPVKVSRQQPQYTLRTMYENATIKPTPYRYKVRHRAPLGLEFALADAMHSSASINSPSISSSADLTGPWNTDLFIIDDTSKFVFGRRNSSLDSLRGSQNTRQF
ncbi:hypothetical protein K501DRAFT_273267 [Backusella circina FSU 941]|nr:hypothetical protein K501DRAFT_273267 [Backusella circina FSU 941]